MEELVKKYATAGNREICEMIRCAADGRRKEKEPMETGTTDHRLVADSSKQNPKVPPPAFRCFPPALVCSPGPSPASPRPCLLASSLKTAKNRRWAAEKSRYSQLQSVEAAPYVQSGSPTLCCGAPNYTALEPLAYTCF